jgi:predicted RNA binding protein YcfA (HicA-like mRNA interferase family)
MSKEPLDALWSHLPEVFQLRDLPPDWDEEWILAPVESPDQYQGRDDLLYFANSDADPRQRIGEVLSWKPPYPEGMFGTFPGALSPRIPGMPPPPDAVGFYLPFHYFYPTWWGIYLTVEGLEDLAGFLCAEANGSLSRGDAIQVARIFVFGHEQYHHCVESFATRLEITHRSALYKSGIEEYFQKGIRAGNCPEEALATAYGFDKVRTAFSKAPPMTQEVIEHALKAYILKLPVVYRKGLTLIGDAAFTRGENAFAEDLHVHSLAIPRFNSELWGTFAHAFHPFRNRNGRVNYIVHRSSPLAERLRFSLRYLSYRDVTQKLRKLTGCELHRNGKGSHEIWRTKNGNLLTIPRHPGDLRRGTLAKIIKQAGLNYSVEQFVSA